MNIGSIHACTTRLFKCYLDGPAGLSPLFFSSSSGEPFKRSASHPVTLSLRTHSSRSASSREYPAKAEQHAIINDTRTQRPEADRRTKRTILSFHIPSIALPFAALQLANDRQTLLADDASDESYGVEITVAYTAAHRVSTYHAPTS
jgi:hypothetical protein